MPLSRLITLTPDEKDLAPSTTSSSSSSSSEVQYQVDQTEPDELQRREKARFAAWEKLLDEILPPVLDVAETILEQTPRGQTPTFKNLGLRSESLS